ncbi:MAG TPA: diphosphomevalonate decarboxylase [Anaerolineales bacterium]|nr:diphosphomevalonate decarboxylase [Anaerolineales bacterium]
MKKKATALAHPNIAFIKYWGNQNQELRIPQNGSLSMNLSGLEARTTVHFDSDLHADQFTLNDEPMDGAGLARVTKMLDRVRRLAGINQYASVSSQNNFPTGSGIASSAAAFAALALAASTAAGLTLSEKETSILARTGSGSASRSVPGGFVEWQAGSDHESSYAFSIAPPEHWDLVDLVAVVSQEHKATGSTAGHTLADTSPFQSARVQDAPRRIDICRTALLEKDFDAFAEIVELDSNMMHAVMQTSSPRLNYWRPATLAIMHAVQELRRGGIPVCYTIDAGPNVHVLCPKEFSDEVSEQLINISGVIKILAASPGGPAKLIPEGGN